MTLSSTISKQTYAGDGTTTAFPIPFLFLDNAHIEAVLRDAAGNETVWTENTEYTLVGAGVQDGGTLTVSTAPADYTPNAGETLVIRRVVPATQETDYPEGGAFPAMAHEAALDKLTMLAQQNDEQLARALRFRVSDPPSLSGEIPGSAARANRFLAFDAAGAPLAAAGQVGGVPVSPFMATLLDDTAAAVARGTLGISLTGIDLYVRDYGAVGDGATDDTAAFAAAIAALAAGQRLRVGVGTYLVTGVTFDTAGVLQLEPGATLKLKASQASNAALLTISAADVLVLGGTFDGNSANQGSATGQVAIYHNGQSRVHVDVEAITGTTGFGFRAIDATDCSVRVRSVTLTGDSGIQWEYSSGDLTNCLTWGSVVDRSDDAANANPCINYTRTGTAAGKIVGCAVADCHTTLHAAPTGANAIGVQFWGSGRGNQVIGGTFAGGTTGISLANGTTESRVTGTHCYDFAYAGVEIADAQRCTVSGCTIDGNGESGSTCFGVIIDGTNVAATGNTVTGCAIANTPDAGIYLLGSAHGCAGSAVTGNAIRISGASADGIYLNSASSGLVSGNNIDGATTARRGIVIDTASNCVVADNNIAHFTAQAIQVLAQAVEVDQVAISGGLIDSGFQFLPLNGGSFGTRCSMRGVIGAIWGTAVQIDVRQVASDASSYVIDGTANGSPEGVFDWGPSSTYTQLDGTPGSQLWIKESGTGNTGWIKADVPILGSKTYDAPSVAAGATTTTTVTVTGAAVGDYAAASLGVDLTGLVCTAYVSAADTVTVVLYNPTAGAVDLASTMLSARVLKQ